MQQNQITKNSPQIQSLRVNVGERGYAVSIGAAALDQLTQSEFFQGNQVLLVTNHTVAALHLAQVLALLSAAQNQLQVETCVLEDGEEHKNLASAEQIFAKLSAMRASRDVTLIALGGGMIGDITGFAAALWMRGVPFVQLPSTLLAMVDSSVGGKTAVNLSSGKNLIGAFWQPTAVLADLNLLVTLPDRQLSAGVAEVLKYGAINDSAFFAWLERNAEKLMARDSAALAYAIAESVRHKAEIVARDPHEKGERMLLNLGHTFGHALELAGGYQKILHGEAVALGMLAAARLSEILALAAGQIELAQSLAADFERLRQLLLAYSLPTQLAFPARATELLALMKLDKKSLSGQLRLILWRGVGKAYVGTASDAQILAAWPAVL